MDTVKIFGLIQLLFVRGTNQKEACPSTTSHTFYELEWPTTETETLSNPPCVNKNMEFLYRKCENGLWSSEPDCFYIQPITAPECPPNFSSIGDYCFTLLENQTFPPKCPYPNVVSFDTYKDLIPKLGPIWLPVHRNLTYSLGFLQWIEPSVHYKMEYRGNPYAPDRIVKNKNCVVYHNDSYIYLTSCDEKYTGVCCYKKLGKLINNLCEENCYQGDFNSTFSCICLEHGEVASQAELLQPYQNSIYNILTDEVCAIGLEKINGSYIWNTSQEKISYSFWATDVVFDQEHLHGVASPSGWLLQETPSDCVLTQRTVNELESASFLKYNNNSGMLVLELENTKLLFKLDNVPEVYCFTDADSSTLLYRYPELNQTCNDDDKVAFEFAPLDDGPGNYWCEYKTYPEVDFISTDVIFVENQSKWGFEYVAYLNVQYVEGLNPLSFEIISFVTNVFLNTIGANSASKFCCTSRFMKILNLDEFKNTALLNVHFTSKDHNSTMETEYAQLKTYINDSFQFISSALTVELVQLLNSQTCLTNSTTDLVWPQSNISQTVFPDKYCFNKKGQIVTRTCTGNFIDGASWSPVEDCQVFEQTAISKTLMATRYKSKHEVMDVILNVSWNVTLLKPLDIYLIANLYSEFKAFQIDVSPFVETLNNILNVDEAVIFESQNVMMSTKMLLVVISNLMQSQTLNIAYTLDNIAFVSTTANDSAGVFVTKTDDTFKVTHIFDNYSLDDLVRLNVDCAIFLSPILRQQLVNMGSVDFMVFKKDSFFDPSANVSTIFGVSLPNLNARLLEPIQVLFKVNKTTGLKFTCSYWGKTNSKSGWISSSNSSTVDSYRLCTYSSNKYMFLGLVSSPLVSTDNVTMSLVELLDSTNLSSYEENKLKMLSKISQKSHAFIAIDVYLVGKILQQASETLESDLESLSVVVDNLHKINRTILENSQNDLQSTDAILYYIDSITKNYSDSMDVSIVKQNFSLLIFNMDTSNFSGLALIRQETTQILTLMGDISEADISKLKHVESVFWLSPALRRELHGNLIVSIFDNDWLFNDQNRSARNLSKIFGITFPTGINFTGPIYIANRGAASQTQHCAFWDYNPVNGISGFWNQGTEGSELSGLVVCEFWHVTHFALLIYDADLTNDWMLSVITAVCCSLSAFGLGSVLVTAVLFKRWRHNIGNQILINFAFAILFEIVVFYASSFLGPTSENLCISTGVLLHYSILAQFCWMLVIAILQVRRYVVVLGGPMNSLLLKSCTFSWGFPFIPVICVLVFDSDTYIKSTTGLCYPAGRSFVWAIELPISVILLINFIIFIYILYNVVWKANNNCEGGKNETFLQIRLAILLFFMLGLSWGLALLVWMDLQKIFVYLFCITTASQGFVIFLFFILFNSDTRQLYVHLFRKSMQRNQSFSTLS